MRTPGDRDSFMNLQIIQLRAFASLAEQGSYTRVARDLSYTEPAVNMQIRSLERIVGVPLVRREGKRILLTDKGEQLLPLVLELLAKNDQLEAAVRRLQPSTGVVVGGGRNTGVFHLIPLLAKYRLLTGNDPELHILAAEELVGGIVNGQLDVVVAGIGDRLLSHDDRMRHQLVRIPWKHDQIVVIIAPVGGARRLPPRPRGTTMVFLPPYMNLSQREVAEACRPYLPDVRLVSLETADAVKSAVANGLGAGLLPLSAVQDHDAIGVLGALTGASFQPCLHIIHHRSRLLKPQTRRLVSFLVSASRQPRNGHAPVSAKGLWGSDAVRSDQAEAPLLADASR